MVLNSFLGKKKICQMMLAHPTAKFLLPPKTMDMARKYGYVYVRLFGYPLNAMPRMRARTVLSYLAKQNGKVLDIGCSFGILSLELSRRGYSVIGVDTNAASIELANDINGILRLKNVRFVNIDFLDNEFSAGEFDIVIMVEVLEHIKDDGRAIQEIYRILKKDGVLILSVPYADAVEEFPVPTPSCTDFQGKAVELGAPGEFHFRSGYNVEGLFSLLDLNGFGVLRFGFTRAVRTLPKSMLLFPVCYVAALLLSRLSNNRDKLTVLATKKEMEGS